MSRHRRSRPSIHIQPSKLPNVTVAKSATTPGSAKILSPPGTAKALSPGTAKPNVQGFPFSPPGWKPQVPEKDVMDPDEIFVKHTVPEIKSIRAKLRADADAKQEELRLMVGERYRDLLQASTSIISIASSAQSVRASLTRAKALCTVDLEEQNNWEQRRHGHARRYSTVDAQLPLLHAFSAHLKLLLDTPEHLWRLLERKQYLHAAWLYLLARVVYRALVKQDSDEEGEQTQWARLGIDVLEQFPLMQRQWDTVSQFRSQISHRATQSLRDLDQTPEALGDALITVLLLDTLPLVEILSLFLSQRSKALLLQLAQDEPYTSVPAPDLSTPGLGIRPKQTPTSDTDDDHTIPLRRTDVVQQVKEVAKAAIALISRTLGITRQTFGTEGGRARPLIGEMMERIQTVEAEEEIPVSPLLSRRLSLLSPLPEPSKLSAETQLTTSLMLRSFPSAQLLLRFLPPTIQSFTPYIDITSPASHIPPSTLRQKTREWFSSCITALESQSQQWMAVLQSVKEIWDVRKVMLERIGEEEELKEEERRGLGGWVDKTCRGRATEVWKRRLRDLEEAAGMEVDKATEMIRNGAKDSRSDVEPLDFFFTANLSLPSAPLLSSTSLANSSIAMASFQKYHSALQQRASGRTPFVQSVLSAVETMAKELRSDLHTLQEAGQRDQLSRLLEEYFPAANAVCNRVAEKVRALVAEPEGGDEGTNPLDDRTVDLIIFTGRLASIVAHNSSLIGDLAFGRDTAHGFQDTRRAFEDIYRSSVSRWRTYSVEKALREFGTLGNDRWGGDHLAMAVPASSGVLPSQPSPALVQSILSLKHSVCRLGITSTQRGDGDVIAGLLLEYEGALVRVVGKLGTIDDSILEQALFDLCFVASLSDIRLGIKGSAKDDLTGVIGRLREQYASISGQAPNDIESRITASVTQQRQRSQVLFAPILGGGAQGKAEWTNTSLLGWGAPTVEGDVRIPLDLVKPSPRFGLLLVGSSAPLR